MLNGKVSGLALLELLAGHHCSEFSVVFPVVGSVMNGAERDLAVLFDQPPVPT
jgi:hypothetical protein